MQYANSPDLNSIVQMHTDITAPKHGVEVITNAKQGILHVNVDGVCLLRICQIPFFVLNDKAIKGSDA